MITFKEYYNLMELSFITEGAVLNQTVSVLKKLGVDNPAGVIEKMVAYDSSKNNKNVLQFIQAVDKYAPEKAKDIVNMFKIFSLGANKNTDLSKITKEKFITLTRNTMGSSESVYNTINSLLKPNEQKYSKILTDILLSSENKNAKDLVHYFRMFVNLNTNKQISSFNTFEQLEAFVDNNTKATGIKLGANEKIRYIDECIYKDSSVLIWAADTQEKAIRYARQAAPNTWCISREMYSGGNLYYGYRIRFGATFYLVKHLPVGSEVKISGDSNDYSDMMVHVYENGIKYTGKPNGDKGPIQEEQFGKLFPFLNKPEILELFVSKPLNADEKEIEKIVDKPFSSLETEEQQFRYAELGQEISDQQLTELISANRMSVIDAYIGCGAYNIPADILKQLPDDKQENYHRVLSVHHSQVEEMINNQYAPMIESSGG